MLLIIHCHVDGHVFIQEEYHVFLMTFVRSVHHCSGTLTCCALPLPSLQGAQHEIILIPLAFCLGFSRAPNHAYVDIRETFDIFHL